ncbi:hypothetical protein [Methylomicrobium sp. Wu6]|uniref:hypothetical protein n=1 Tax=Methylomicrobium sp. Wu6 TaxID=3107928 RepID=UPI002DD64381|nr:hypothetical protein [Methylomicrobium sp. Wu6]MEC4749933.1 hypothetical protein [Methylomicrobium sp. Wu6]
MTPFPSEPRRYRFKVVGASLLLAVAGIYAVFLAFAQNSAEPLTIGLLLFALAASLLSGYVPVLYTKMAAHSVKRIPLIFPSWNVNP